jgi:hypothetical protein
MSADRRLRGGEKIDHDLGYLLAELDMLSETLPEWEEISETERDIWLFEWSNHLAILRGLTRAHDAGDMNAEQERRYEELLAKLRELPLEGTGLWLP